MVRSLSFALLVPLLCAGSLEAADFAQMPQMDLSLGGPISTPLGVPCTPLQASGELILRADSRSALLASITDAQRLSRVLAPAAAACLHPNIDASSTASSAHNSSFQLVPPPSFRQSSQVHITSDWRSWASLGAGYTHLF